MGKFKVTPALWLAVGMAVMAIGATLVDKREQKAAEALTAAAEASLKAGGGDPACIVVGPDRKVLAYRKLPLPAPSCQ